MEMEERMAFRGAVSTRTLSVYLAILVMSTIPGAAKPLQHRSSLVTDHHVHYIKNEIELL